MTRPSITSIFVGGLLALGACKSAGMGPETRADIAAQMKLAESPIQACYAESLKHNRKVRGRISLRLVAEASTGQFTNISVLRDEPRDPAITQCVVAEIGKLKLGKPTSSNLLIDQAINLMPSN